MDSIRSQLIWIYSVFKKENYSVDFIFLSFEMMDSIVELWNH